MAWHQVLTCKCTNFLLCMEDMLPRDVVRFIVNICWNSNPVAVLLTCDDNIMPHDLYDRWEMMKINSHKSHPQLRFRTMKWSSIKPCGLATSDRYRNTYREIPVALLIPGPVWDAMIIQYEIIDSSDELVICKFEFPGIEFMPSGVQELKGLLCGNTIDCAILSCDYELWLDKCINNETFLRIQNGVHFEDKSVVPQRSLPSEYIEALLVFMEISSMPMPRNTVHRCSKPFYVRLHEWSESCVRSFAKRLGVFVIDLTKLDLIRAIADVRDMLEL